MLAVTNRQQEFELQVVPFIVTFALDEVIITGVVRSGVFPPENRS